MNLIELCEKYKAHKFSYCLEVYEQVFAPLSNKPIKLLEIGIQNGGSLKAWQEYFPNGSIFGIDIDKKYCTQSNHFCGSQSDLLFLSNVLEKIGTLDIIIDDGSHHNCDQQTSFNFLFPKMSNNGIYAIEDMHDNRPEFFSNGYVHTKDWIKNMSERTHVVQDIGFIYKN